MTRRTAWRLTPSLLAAAVFLGGCDGIQSALAPQGPEAHRVAVLTWVLFAGSGVILLAVILLTALAMFGPPYGGSGSAARRSWSAAGSSSRSSR